jgi:hypothetical protein
MDWGGGLFFLSGEEFQNQVAHLLPMEQEQMFCPANAVEFAVPIQLMIPFTARNGDDSV